jgi:uncharacterized protein YkwD
MKVASPVLLLSLCCALTACSVDEQELDPGSSSSEDRDGPGERPSRGDATTDSRDSSDPDEGEPDDGDLDAGTAEPPRDTGNPQDVGAPVDAGQDAAVGADSATQSDVPPAPDAGADGRDCSSSDEARYACCVFDQVNAYRQTNSLAPYQWNDGLSRAGFYYADFMATNRVFAHSADGMNVGERLDEYGVAWASAGENLQRNDLRDWSLACNETVNGRGGWANSRSGHREAMLGQDASGTNKNWTHAAAGVARDGDQWYVAMYFVRF